MLGFGVPDSLTAVRVELNGTDIALHFVFDSPEELALTEQAQMIGTEVISHASSDMRIDEHIIFAAEPAHSEVGRRVFKRH